MYNGSSFRFCSHQPTIVLETELCTIWGAAGRDVEEQSWDLVISLCGRKIVEPTEIIMNDEAEALLGDLLQPPEPAQVIISWPDFGVPTFDREFWEDLFERLSKIEGDIVICCEGGHGRTGTALACLLAVSGQLAYGEDPVKFLRREYCAEAVESDAQIRYIEKILGYQIESRSSYVPKAYEVPGNRLSAGPVTGKTLYDDEVFTDPFGYKE